LILYLLALVAAAVTLWDFSDGYGSVFPLMLVIPLWALVLVVWLGMVIGNLLDVPTARDIVAWSLVPVLVIGVAFLSIGPILDLRFRLSVFELDALADQMVAGKAVPEGTSAGMFAVEFAEAWGREVRFTIGHAGFLDEIMLVRDAGAGGCTEHRRLDERWTLCYRAY
jgi:hypothetical protein